MILNENGFPVWPVHIVDRINQSGRFKNNQIGTDGRLDQYGKQKVVNKRKTEYETVFGLFWGAQLDAMLLHQKAEEENGRVADS